MTKKGQSHLEIILSFLIFMAVLAFAIYFFRPTNVSRIAETSMDYIFREIEENATTYLRVYSIKINNGSIPNKEGAGFDGATKEILQIEKFENMGDRKVNVYTKDNRQLISNIPEGSNYIKIKSPFDDGWRKIDFIYVYINENFTNGNLESGEEIEFNNRYYEIGSSYSDKIISKDYMLKLNKTYYADYIKLKTQFNIPNRVNFEFELNLESENIAARREIPRGLETYSRQKRVKVLDNGKVVYGDLIVRVW